MVEFFIDYVAWFKLILFFSPVYVLILFYYCKYYNECLYRSVTDKTKHVLVTGCDTGFGYFTVFELNKFRIQAFAGCLTHY